LSQAVQARILSGLFLVLPVIITFVILGYLYQTLRQYLLDPVASWIVRLAGSRLNEALPDWWIKFFSPFLAIVLILALLYVLGYFVRSRLFQVVDWILLHVPVVTTVYKSVRTAVSSMEGDAFANQFKRVVLVSFPYPGSKALGFVTKVLRDQATDRTILCVVVLTGVLPPAGFTLFLPEEDVLDLNWSTDQALQAILTGGLSAPTKIGFFPAGAVRDQGGRGVSEAVASGTPRDEPKRD
jgi:uncharacterized membrane protein